MRKVLPWLITIVSCLLVTGALAAVKYQQITAAIAFGASFPEPYEVVNAQQVSTASHTPVRRLGGTVRRPEFVEISPEVGGRIVALPHQSGAIVKKGQPLLELFSADLTAQQEALKAERDLTITQLGRSRKLQAQSLIAQDDIDVQQARLNALNAQIRAIDAQLTRLTLRAPFDGRMGIYTHVVGDMIDSGEVIADFTGLGTERWIDFKVPQGLARLSIGDTVSIFDLDNRLLGTATIIVVSDTIDANTRTFDVRAITRSDRLKHGELLQIEVNSGAPAVVYELPPASIRWDTEGTYIFELTDAEAGAQQPFRAVPTRVTLVDESATVALFTADLDETALFATTGAFKLSDGVLARLYNGAK
jgi:membrane fusion protein (multidrug efflux system)